MALSGAKTTSQTIDYRALVAEAEADGYPFFEHDAYEFTTKLFREDDNAGVYNDNEN